MFSDAFCFCLPELHVAFRLLSFPPPIITFYFACLMDSLRRRSFEALAEGSLHFMAFANIPQSASEVCRPGINLDNVLHSPLIVVSPAAIEVCGVLETVISVWVGPTS